LVGLKGVCNVDIGGAESALTQLEENARQHDIWPHIGFCKSVGYRSDASPCGLNHQSKYVGGHENLEIWRVEKSVN
jgi:hypothetical protein